MGVRKKERAQKLKEAKKTLSFAKLNNCPTSPRKMRKVSDMIKGHDVFKALGILQFSPQDAAKRLEKLLRSARANWETKNEGARPEESNLIVKSIQVDSARMLKRIQPAPQGRAHRVRKRSNHVTLIVDSKN